MLFSLCTIDDYSVITTSIKYNMPTTTSVNMSSELQQVVKLDTIFCTVFIIQYHQTKIIKTPTTLMQGVSSTQPTKLILDISSALRSCSKYILVVAYLVAKGYQCTHEGL